MNFIPNLFLQIKSYFDKTVLAIACIPCIFFPFISDDTQSPIFLYISALEVLYLSYILYTFRNISYKIGSIDGLILPYLLTSGFAFYHHSLQSESQYEWHRILFFVNSYFVLKIGFTIHLDSIKSILIGLLLAGFIYMIFGYLDYLRMYSDINIHHGLYQMSGHMGHKNLLAIFLSMCLPIAMYFFQLTTSKGFRILLGIYCLSIFILIGISMSRVGYLGLFIFCSYELNYYRKRFFDRKYRFLVAALCLILTICLVKNDRGKEILKRTVSIVHPSANRDENSQSVRERWVLWSKTIEMIKDRPIDGVGLGAWKLNILKYNINETRSKFGYIIFQQPHNDFLWVWAENGVLALIFYSLLFAVPLFWVFKNSSRQPIIAFISLGIFIFFVQSNFDFPKERPLLLFVLAVMFAIFSFYSSKSQLSIKFSKTILILILAVSIESCYFFVRRIQTEMTIKSLNLARINKKWQEIIGLSHDIKSHNVQYDQTSTPIDFYMGEANFMLGNYFDARHDFSNSIALNSTHLYSWNDLGGVFAKLENHQKAKQCWLKAIGISSDFAEPRLNLANYYWEEGNVDSSLLMLKFQIEKEAIQMFNPDIFRLLKFHIVRLKNQKNRIEYNSEFEKLLSDESRIFWLYNQYCTRNLTFEEETMKNIHWNMKKKY